MRTEFISKRDLCNTSLSRQGAGADSLFGLPLAAFSADLERISIVTPVTSAPLRLQTIDAVAVVATDR